MSSGAGLRVLDEHVEVAVVVEDAGVEQLVLRIAARAPAVLRDEILVRKGPLRILVEHPHVRVARNVVEVEVALLHVLAVVALVPREAEQALLEDRVRAVPQREREAQPLPVVADAGDAVLAPAIGARARVVVRQVLPRRAVGAVVLAHRSPLPLADVGAPAPPWRLALARRGEARLFGGQRGFSGGHGDYMATCATTRGSIDQVRCEPLTKAVHGVVSPCRQAGAEGAPGRRRRARARLRRARARSRRSGAARGLRHQRSSRFVVHRGVHAGAYPRDHAGDLRLPERPADERPALPRQGHARAVGSGAGRGARSARRQRRGGRLPAGRRLHADAGDLPRDPRAQPRPRGTHRGRHRDHAVAQSAGGRRVQVQPAARRPGRFGRDDVDPAARQRAARGGQPGRAARSARERAARADDACARSRAALRPGSAERHRHGGDPRGRALARRRSSGRRRRRLLGADQSRSTVSTSPSSTRRWIRRSPS